jgi:hypothetical protein
MAGLVGIKIKTLCQLVSSLTPDHGTPVMNNCLTEYPGGLDLVTLTRSFFFSA